MTPSFDRPYWDEHWRQAAARSSGSALPPNPYLVRQVGEVPPGSALDAGCGEGAEAIWLAGLGWRVSAVDISREALARAGERAARSGVAADGIGWVEADLGVWEPGRQYDLVTTHYAHPAMPQLDFYERLAGWVAHGGTLLIVGHRHDDGAHGHRHGAPHQHPEEVSVTAVAVTERLDPSMWEVVTVDEPTRTVTNNVGHAVTLADVVVCARRR